MAVVLGGLLWSWGAAGVAQEVETEEVLAAREQAQTLFEEDHPREAVATLAELAAKHPKDRVVGALLYTGIRDHVWHIPQILPVSHKGPVKALAFSTDGAWLASGATTGEVFLSPTEPIDDEGTGRIPLKVEGEILGLVFSRDGKRLAVATTKGPVQVWSVPEAKLVYEAPKPAGAIVAFAAVRDANRLAVGTDTGAIQIVDITAGLVVASAGIPGGPVQALTFSTSGAKVAAASVDRRAHVWDASTGKDLGAGVKHQAAIHSIDFSSDEKLIISAGADRTAWISDPATGQAARPALDCETTVRKVVVSPDGSMLATVLDDGSTLIWDVATGTRRDIVLREDDPLIDFAWTRSALRAVTTSEGNHATLWTMRNGTRRGETMPHGGAVLAAELSTDSRLLATGCADGLARIWRTDGGQPLPTVRAHAARARTAFYSLDGEHLITTSEDHTALHWISGQVRPFGPALKHADKVNCGVFNYDATQILTADDSGVAQLWNAETGQPNGAPFRHDGPVAWVDFAPDGKRLVTASGDTVRVWDPAKRDTPVATIRHPGQEKSRIIKVRYSSNGKWLVTASTDGTARVWDAATYQPVGAPIDRGFPVLGVRFSPDSSRLAVGGEDSHVIVYDTATWKPVGTPILTPGPVFSIAITEDNLFLVVSSLLLDAVQFFEIANGRPLGAGLPIPSQATCVDYHLLDKVVVVACDDGTVRAVEAPFVTQNVPAWVGGFAERLVGLRKTGPDTFEHVDSQITQLRTYVSTSARSTNADFARLVRWKMSPGADRNGMPRFTSTLADNIERRVDERSADALFECYEAVSGDPLILGALSLYLPNLQHSQFIAGLVQRLPETKPLARCYVAATLLKAGRDQEATTVMNQALADAPNDPRVIRRAAKLQARLKNREVAVQLFEKSIAIDPTDVATRRDYAWALYSFNEPALAAAQFQSAQNLAGDMVDDIVAGLCLCAAAQKDAAAAKQSFTRLVSIDPLWKEPGHIAQLQGWTPQEQRELETVRLTLFP